MNKEAIVGKTLHNVIRLTSRRFELVRRIRHILGLG
jgi:hypothetical protein